MSKISIQVTFLEKVAVKLPSNIVTINGKLLRKERYGYIIPFCEGLAKFIGLPKVHYFMNNSHASRTKYMIDICDGKFIKKNNELFKRNPKAFQIILNTDYIEIVNPIGSHTKKQKLSMFYYTLGNIPPEHRSSLHAIQLLAVAKTKDLRKVGPELLLSDFITSVNSMATGGLPMEVSGREVVIEGALVTAPCDTPAANWLRGSKDGAGFAFKACRRCSSCHVMKTCLLKQKFALRFEEEHKREV